MSMKIGLIGRKLGMSRFLTSEGDHIPVTLVHVNQCQVVSQKTLQKDGYSALQLGVEDAKVQRISKPLRGHFSKAGVLPKKRLAEFLVSENDFLNVGSVLGVDHCQIGQFVDVSGISLGKGFAGAVRRWGFGVRGRNNVSLSHRSLGSVGNRTDPGRVFPGKKMAGRMGCARVTIQNLMVVNTDINKGLIFLKGSIPGFKGSYVIIRNAVKKQNTGLSCSDSVVKKFG